MWRVWIVLSLALFTAACGTGPLLPALNSQPTPAAVIYPTLAPPMPSATPTPGAPSFKVSFVLDPSLTAQDTSIVTAWTAYAQARAGWIEKNVSPQLVADGGYRRSFDEELAGRSALALAWQKAKKAEPRLQDIYLDQLLQIYTANFIREYTWSYFADPSWDQPNGLYLKLFTQWMKGNMKRVHIPETLATVQVTLEK